MQQQLNCHRTGVALGALFGLAHLCWSILVALGVAQRVMDFVFNLHMIQPPYTVMPFSLGSAVVLVIFTSIVGYVVGCAIACVWNMIQKNSK